MKLPAAANAIIDLRKLEEYCLCEEHPRGKHKAQVFRLVLGVGAEQSRELEEQIRNAILSYDCVKGEQDRFGRRYTVDFPWVREKREATVRSTWIVLTGEEFPRLTSCYVL